MVDMVSVCADHALFTIDTALAQFEINVNLGGWADSPWFSGASALPVDFAHFLHFVDCVPFRGLDCVPVASRKIAHRSQKNFLHFVCGDMSGLA